MIDTYGIEVKILEKKINIADVVEEFVVVVIIVSENKASNWTSSLRVVKMESIILCCDISDQIMYLFFVNFVSKFT